MIRKFRSRGIVFALTVGLGMPAMAQEAKDGAFERTPDSEITVTGSRIGAELKDVPTAISILNREDLASQLSLSSNPLRALDTTVPGLNVSRGDRSQGGATIRGRKPSFQINGIPVNQGLRPSNSNSIFQISPYGLDRIEVVRGATALFGAGSPGGIINLITRRATTDRLEIDAVVQTSFNTNNAKGSFANDLYAGIGQKIGDFDYYAGFGYQDYSVERDPNGARLPGTEFTSLAVNGSLGWDVSSQTRLRFTGTWYRENPGQEYNQDGADIDAGTAFPRVIAVNPNPFVDQARDGLYTIALSLESDDVLGHKLFAAAYHQRQQFRQRANFQDGNGGADDFFSDNRTNQTTGLRLTLARNFALGQSADLGIEYGVDYQRDNLIRLLLDPADPSTVTGFIAPDVTLNMTGLFGQATLTLGKFKLSGGARQELYRGKIGTKLASLGLPGTGTPGNFKKEDLLLLNAGLVYDLTSRFQLYASFNQGAELTQLGRAARSATDASLISPQPAISEQFEVGARGDIGAVNISLAGFYSRSEAASLLQADPSCAGQSFCPLIPLRAPQRVWGVEGSIDWSPTDKLDLGGIFTWQRGEIFDEDEGRFLPFSADTVSPTRFSAYAAWKPSEQLSTRVQATYVAATNFFSTTEQVNLGLINTPSYFIADLNVGYKIGPGEITLGISNLFNREYENVTALASGFTRSFAVGRRISIGYQARF
jgi:iron complex outermembrane recepter protein